MSTLSDHVRRDAEHAARMEISILVSKYIRRLVEESKAHIAQTLTELEGTGPVDGTEIGRQAAATAISNYLGGEPREAVESKPRKALGFKKGT